MTVPAGTLSVRALSGVLGAEVTGVDLRDVADDNIIDSLREAFAEYAVLVFPGQQDLTPDQQVAFAAHWGDVHYMPTPDVCVQGNRAVMELDFHGKKPPTDMWHSDVTMEARPPTVTFLLGRVIPLGGDTIFANQYLAFEKLSDGMKKMLIGLKAVHTGEKFADAYRDTQGDDGSAAALSAIRSVHPVVLTHPETGRRALYVNGIYTSHFDGMTVEESAPLLQWLCDYCVQPNFTFRHRWKTGDLLMWDNRCLQHFAVDDYGASRRVMHRVTVLGDRPG